MAKAARGLPSDFALNIPDDGPVHIGDFLDEAPPQIVVRPKPVVRQEPEVRELRPEVIREHAPAQVEVARPRPVQKKAQPAVIRYQLNLTPRAKTMLEELVEHVQRYSPENDARVSEVFQGIVGLLHGAMDDLELSDLPRRGAWGSVTARNFPGALGEVFERAIIRSAQKRGLLR